MSKGRCLYWHVYDSNNITIYEYFKQYFVYSLTLKKSTKSINYSMRCQPQISLPHYDEQKCPKVFPFAGFALLSKVLQDNIENGLRTVNNLWGKPFKVWMKWNKNWSTIENASEFKGNILPTIICCGCLNLSSSIINNYQRRYKDRRT